MTDLWDDQEVGTCAPITVLYFTGSVAGLSIWKIWVLAIIFSKTDSVASATHCVRFPRLPTPMYPLAFCLLVADSIAQGAVVDESGRQQMLNL
jgi:hypothetical protein